MKVNVLFFGATADVVGARELETAVSETAVASEVINHLTEQHPNLRDHKLLFAVNEEYVAQDTRLRDGDQLAIFTPVSGG